LTARHSSSGSVIVVVALPFACFGQQLADKDLPSFAMRTAEGIKKTWDINDPVYGAYTIGKHSVWIERATGAPTGHTDVKFNVEIACSILKKAAVCWMGMTTNTADKNDFEHGAVTLDADTVPALVPADALTKKP